MGIGVYILSTGTELSNGHSKDTNAPHIAKELSHEGFHIVGISTIPDIPALLKKNILHVLEQIDVQLVIMSGGLGPTHDDHTVNVISSLWKKEIVEEPTALARLKKLCERDPEKFHIEKTRTQTRIPKGALIFKNNIGIAPGFLLKWEREKNTCLMVALPGVPREMEAMFSYELFPYLKKSFSKGEIQKPNRRVFYLYNMGESNFQASFFGISPSPSKKLKKNVEAIPILEPSSVPKDFQWGVSAKDGRLRIFIESHNTTYIKKAFQLAKKNYTKNFSEEDAQDLLHKICLEKKLKIAIAESCTGGLVSKLITDYPNSSAYFQGSIISYSNEVKISHLGVPKKILSKEGEGAVSKECVLAMAEGVIKNIPVDYAMSISGIAGPGGGEANKPVGSVFIGLATKNQKKCFYKLYYPFNRADVRAHSAHTSLFFFYKFICEHLAF